MALGLAEHYREETGPERYYQACWATVRKPYLNAFQYRFALQALSQVGSRTSRTVIPPRTRATA